jgi:hypothetical protein
MTENASIPLSEVQALEDEVKHNMEMLAALQSAPVTYYRLVSWVFLSSAATESVFFSDLLSFAAQVTITT